MNDVLDDRITETLARRAGALDTAPRTTADQIVARGDRARHRHRAAVAGAAALAVLAVGGAVAQLGRIPADRTAPRPTTATAPPGLRALGFDVLDAGTQHLITADGTRVTIGYRYPRTIRVATRVPGGWVVEAADPAGRPALLFVTPDGSVRPLAVYDPSGNYAVSADGHTLVVTQVYLGRGRATTLAVAVAYALPGGETIGAVGGPDAAFDHILVRGVIGGRAVLNDSLALDDGVWDYTRSGKPTLSVDIQEALSVSDAGLTLYNVPEWDRSGRHPVSCLSVLSISQFNVVSRAPRTCLPGAVDAASLSPDGSLAFVDGVGMFRVADLIAGGAKAVPLAPGFRDYREGAGPVRQWTSDNRIVLRKTAGNKAFFTWAVCGGDGSCTAAPGPAGFGSPVPAANRVG